MQPRYRSLTGFLRVLALVPLFFSLAACLPTGPKIGNPEKARIDPAMSGLWLDAEGTLFLFEPYDKRTWLLTMAVLEDAGDACSSAAENAEDTSVIEMPFSVGDAETGACVKFGGELALYKAWRTKLGGQWFVTWEHKGIFDADIGFGPHVWWTFREVRVGPDRIDLQFVDFSNEKFHENKALVEWFDAVENDAYPIDPSLGRKASKAAERVLRKADEDDEMFAADDIVVRLSRVAAEHLGVFDDVFREALGSMD